MITNGHKWWPWPSVKMDMLANCHLGAAHPAQIQQKITTKIQTKSWVFPASLIMERRSYSQWWALIAWWWWRMKVEDTAARAHRKLPPFWSPSCCCLWSPIHSAYLYDSTRLSCHTTWQKKVFWHADSLEGKCWPHWIEIKILCVKYLPW